MFTILPQTIILTDKKIRKNINAFFFFLNFQVRSNILDSIAYVKCLQVVKGEL